MIINNSYLKIKIEKIKIINIFNEIINIWIKNIILYIVKSKNYKNPNLNIFFTNIFVN
jgi:hypothetical protein